MRIARNQLLEPNDLVHSIWRGHNGEWIFTGDSSKAMYLTFLAASAQSSDFRIHSVCLMNSHSHITGEVATADGFSHLFHRAHSRYAQQYNSLKERRGAVGMGRPRSLVIQKERHLMNAAFYVDTNPVRAKVVKHPRDYRWSSYNFYAYGKREPWTHMIKVPEWYLKLGCNPKARQRAYRRLCDAYLRDQKPRPSPGRAAGHYIGESRWIAQRRLNRKLAAFYAWPPTARACFSPDSS